jgi:hypothetical protein
LSCWELICRVLCYEMCWFNWMLIEEFAMEWSIYQNNRGRKDDWKSCWKFKG